MSDKYAALKQAKPYELRFSRLWERYDEACHGNAEHMRDILELALDALETAERRIAKSDRDVLALLAERDADKRRIDELTAERDALREGEMGDAKHSNTRAAADIYFQLVEECEIPPGGSLVEHIDDMRERLAELEARTLTVKLPDYRATYKEAFASEVEHHVRNELEKLAAAAGISLKIEGE